MTQGERLARIEALLEALPKIEAKLDKIEMDLSDDKAELASLKNKGTGILIGVGLVAGGIGAGLTKVWQAFLG